MARVLVVDDEESIRYTFADFIGTAGHRVATAESLKEGLEKVRETVFDFVFVDMLLGDGNGMVLLEEIRRLNPSCRVIIMSGYPNHGAQSEVLRLGGYRYLRKPVNQEMLIGIVGLATRTRS